MPFNTIRARVCVCVYAHNLFWSNWMQLTGYKFISNRGIVVIIFILYHNRFQLFVFVFCRSIRIVCRCWFWCYCVCVFSICCCCYFCASTRIYIMTSIADNQLKMTITNDDRNLRTHIVYRCINLAGPLEMWFFVGRGFFPFLCFIKVYRIMRVPHRYAAHTSINASICRWIQ